MLLLLVSCSLVNKHQCHYIVRIIFNYVTLLAAAAAAAAAVVVVVVVVIVVVVVVVVVGSSSSSSSIHAPERFGLGEAELGARRMPHTLNKIIRMNKSITNRNA